MKAKIISIGDELLIGQVVDTNSAWIASTLNSEGIETIKKITVPDDADVITKTLNDERQDVDVILITGGLGPTRDDKTKAVLTRYFDDKLVLHEETLHRISEYFNTIKRRVTEDNHNQAMVPSKCKVLRNEFGTAPGMWFEDKGQIFISMPGVPGEMKSIMTNEVIHQLSQRNSNGDIRSRTYITVNIPESLLSERLSEFEDNLPSDIKLAYLPHLNMVRLRLTTRTHGKERATETLNSAESALFETLGEDIIWTGDLRMEEIVGKMLTKAKKTFSIAESCTGGFVSHKITSVAGASNYFPGSVISYSYDIKTSELQVPSELLWEVGAVSEEVVRKMATSVRRNMKSEYSLAISGIAGPGGGTKDKPVGTVWMAVAGPDEVWSKRFQFRGDRARIVERSSISGLNMIRELLLNDHPELNAIANPAVHTKTTS